jgi:choline kinase
MIVIPMAGLSSRFFKAGYNKPKYMLNAHGKSLFEHSVRSFEEYFDTQTFIFIVKDIYDTVDFVSQQANKMRVKKYEIVTLDKDTRGQAETVALGLERLKFKRPFCDEPITIFNIDTIRPGFVFPKIINKSDGFLEVFKGEGDNWSFAKPAYEGSTVVIETAEKKAISNLCSTGLYYFKSMNDFLEAYHHVERKPASEWDKGELYIAPLYNYLIEGGKVIHYNLIKEEEVIFCGVPREYEEFKSKVSN